MSEGITPADAVEFVRRHGVVLESARGLVPSLAAAVAGAPIRGSWWSHPAAHVIFAAINAVRDSPDIAVTRLLDGKVTYVHRRLWAPIVRLSTVIEPQRLAVVHEAHTRSVAHRTWTAPFPDWVPDEILVAARGLSEDESWARLEGVASVLRRATARA